MLTFVTTCRPDFRKAWIFPSLARLNCRVVCLLEPEDKRELPKLKNGWRVDYLAPNVQFQAGQFLETVPDLSADDILILADADAVVQRDFEPDELDVLTRLGDGLAMGYNLRPGQTGEEEYRLLRPRQEMGVAAAELGIADQRILSDAWIYNTGLVAGKVSTWRQLRRLYHEVDTEHASELFALYSWPQYLICCVAYAQGIPIVELGYETHSHGHFRLTPEHHLRDGRLYYRDRLVFFAHNVPGVTA